MNELIEEMRAKVTANCGMTLTLGEVKAVLAALTSLETVQGAALGVETVAATLPPVEPELLPESEFEELGTADDVAMQSGFTGAMLDSPPAVEKKGPLPEDFPGRHALAGAGVNTFAQARKARDSKEGLMGITGVGHATAMLIEEALD